jgi:arylsulfatase A-like enzyme/Flp pilus assembly protein TadD
LLGLTTTLIAITGCEDTPSPGTTREAGQAGSTAAARSSPQDPPPNRQLRRPSKRLNLILITLDTARADAFGAYGQAMPTSPHIDRMAQEGVLFDDAMTASPSTLPSHATIMTGLLPFAHGVRSNTGYLLGEEQTTLAEILTGRGYTTSAEIAAPVIGRHTRLDQGFLKYREPSDYDIERKKIFVADPNAKNGRRLIEAHDRDGSDITKHGLEFIERNRDGDRPFFLWLHYFDPHIAYQAPTAFRVGFEQSAYHAEIHYTDHQVGRILKALRQTGLRERTLVVLTSDHGEGLGEHDESTHSFFVYESTMRVPLLLWGPGSIPQGRRISTPVRTTDIAPTILEWLGLPAPPAIHGRSLRPLVDREPDAGVPGPGYGESVEPLALFGSSMLRTLRTGDWKYIHKLEPELYRVDRDPGELENLASLHLDRVQAMRDALSEFVRTGQQSPDSRAVLDRAQRAQLQALGYLGAETPDGFNDAEDLRAVHGPDPSQAHGDLEAYVRAHGRLFDGDAGRAADDFRALLELHPDSVAIRDGLLEAQLAAENWAELVPLAEQILEQDSTHQMATEALGAALIALGREKEAEAHWRRAADAFPCDSGMSSRLSIFLSEWGQESDHIQALETTLNRCPDSASAKNDLSFAYSTTSDVSLRNGAESLRLAREAVDSEGGERPDFLDTLACAQARVGDFDGALVTIERALEMLRLREFPAESIQALEAHKAAFEKGQPVSDTPPSSQD